MVLCKVLKACPRSSPNPSEGGELLRIANKINNAQKPSPLERVGRGKK
jgi:hypothetical protein